MKITNNFIKNSNMQAFTRLRLSPNPHNSSALYALSNISNQFQARTIEAEITYLDIISGDNNYILDMKEHIGDDIHGSVTIDLYKHGYTKDELLASETIQPKKLYSSSRSYSLPAIKRAFKNFRRIIEKDYSSLNGKACDFVNRIVKNYTVSDSRYFD